MNRLSDLLVSKIGRENIHKNSNAGRVVYSAGLARTSEFRRIDALPRRVWEEEYSEELSRLLTDAFSARGADGSVSLWKIQAAAIREIHDRRGAFLPISVGGGKALISLLAPVVVEAKNPILLVPADLREQTKRKVLPWARNHFRLNPRLRVIGYSEISLAKNAELLEKLSPDMLILDECHALKNPSAGRTKRVHRYLKAHPETVVVAMSGTVSNRSLKDYAHIIRWCLGEHWTPLPAKWQELSDWADALDAGVPDHARMAPGAIERWCEPGESPREGYRRRLTETPGVIASGAEELGTSLRINRIDPKLPPEVHRVLLDLRNTWEDPNGDELTEAVEVWRVARQIVLGFWYQWDPPAPREWMEARSEWKKHVRETLKNNRRKLDTELQVWNECEREGTFEVWKRWKGIKDTFKPNPVPRWISKFIAEPVGEWVERNQGIVWVEHRAVGNMLSAELGIPYFGAGAKASSEILDAKGPIIASIASHGQGKNLQQWSTNLITSPPTSGKTWEQLLGRTHRAGQTADEVFAWSFLHAEELENSFRQALADARYLEQTLGARQRLNYADFSFAV